MARDIGKELGCSEFLREGVYAMVGGPSFESPAELRLLNSVADVVGKRRDSEPRRYSAGCGSWMDLHGGKNTPQTIKVFSRMFSHIGFSRALRSQAQLSRP